MHTLCWVLFKCDSLLVFKFIPVQAYHLLRSGYKQKWQMPGMLVTHTPPMPVADIGNRSAHSFPLNSDHSMHSP